MTNPQHHVEIQEFTNVGPGGAQRGYKAYCTCGWSARAEWDRPTADDHARLHLEQVTA